MMLESINMHNAATWLTVGSGVFSGVGSLLLAWRDRINMAEISVQR